MTSIRFLLKDLRVIRFWSVWTRYVNVGSVVRRCRRDRSVREVFHCVRQTFLKSRRTLLLSATAAYKVDDEGGGEPPPCEQNISDDDLQGLLEDLQTVQELVKSTLYCNKCKDRIVIDKKLPGVKYCTCQEPQPPQPSPEGWEPYMEAEDVIIWRKEYKPGQGLFAYKVYGRYSEVLASDFAAIQVDGGYRRVWDQAVASMSIVERSANGILDQAVLHWEVLWPRLFANRDYVYIRRHKEFNLNAQVVPTPNPAQKPGQTTTGQNPSNLGQNPSSLGQNPSSTGQAHPTPGQNPSRQTHSQKQPERPSVHSNAKRKSEELYKQAQSQSDQINKQKDVKEKRQEISVDQRNIDLNQDVNGDRAFVIISRSCIHPEVPETKHAIRVLEYWSHMVVKTLHGAEKPGMEYVLTYYDEPAVGGLPSGVASWATGRAAPAYLARMRTAAADYRGYIIRNRNKDAPDFTPFRPDKVSYEEERISHRDNVSEKDMESSQQGPELENGEATEVRDQSTQTVAKTTEDKAVEVHIESRTATLKPDEPERPEDSEKPEDEEQTTSWWRHLYPFYYFV